MKTIKRIAAFVLAISFCFVLMLSPGAHAQGAITGQQFGAWIASALVSLNCVGQILGGDFQTSIDAFHTLQHNIGVPTIQETIDSLPTPYDVYTFGDSAVSEALNNSIIKVRKGVTTIDGVQYDELWVSPEGAQKLKTNAFDFITKYNLISNDTSTLATGWGNFEGVDLYKVNEVVRTQSLELPKWGTIYKNGPFYVRGRDIGFQNRTNIDFYQYPYTGAYTSGGPLFTKSQYPVEVWWSINPDTGSIRGQTVNGSATVGTISGGIEEKPFQYDFVSGVIPAQESISNDYGLSVKIPHEQLQNFYNVYPQYNVDNSVINIQQDEIDINELTKAIFDYVESMQDIKAEWTNGEEPEPPGPAEDVLTGVNTIIEQQNMQISQNMQDYQMQQQQLQQQQQIDQNTSSIKETIESVTETPTTEDLPDFKFDLRELFPFCIPFDIYRLLSSFDAEPQAPHVQLPVVIESIGFSYNLDLDFSAWDPVAQAMRTAELIVYAIALAWATGKVIKW